MATPPEPPRHESHTPSTTDPLVGHWEDLRHQLRSWWDRLTEADLAQIGGQRDRLISLLQQRYGYTRQRAQQEVDQRLQEYGGQAASVAPTVTSAAQGVASTVTETAGSAAAKTQEMVAAAATAVTNTVTGAGTYVQEKGVQALPGDLVGLIRRHPVPALLIGLGIGFVLGRSLGTGRTPPGS
jgi:uncharacterized protein YjbJ (UPF0337 family)